MCLSAPPMERRSPDQHFALLIEPLVNASKMESRMVIACSKVSLEHCFSSEEGKLLLGAVTIQSLYAKNRIVDAFKIASAGYVPISRVKILVYRDVMLEKSSGVHSVLEVF